MFASSRALNRANTQKATHTHCHRELSQDLNVQFIQDIKLARTAFILQYTTIPTKFYLFSRFHFILFIKNESRGHRDVVLAQSRLPEGLLTKLWLGAGWLWLTRTTLYCFRYDPSRIDPLKQPTRHRSRNNPFKTNRLRLKRLGRVSPCYVASTTV